MENKLCRICGRDGQDFINIFKTEGLKNKIETCLPIVVSPHCLLPDTVCPQCQKTIENFYIFLKNCLENIIILESQLDIQESCLKTKRKKDKSCFVELSLSNETKCIQTEDYLNVLFGDTLDFRKFEANFPRSSDFLHREVKSKPFSSIVDYEILSDTHSDDSNSNMGEVIFGEKLKTLNHFNNLVDDILSKHPSIHDLHRVHNPEHILSYIVERKVQNKRRSDSIEYPSTKLCRLDSGNKRKCSNPKKLEKSDTQNLADDRHHKVPEIKVEKDMDDEFVENKETGRKENIIGNTANISAIRDRCLLCNIQVDDSTRLAEHFVAVHQKEFCHQSTETPNGSVSNAAADKKKKSLPSLVKISDLRGSESVEDGQVPDYHSKDLSISQTKMACPHCPAAFITKAELFIHLQLKHADIPTYLCGICLKQMNSFANLKSHVQICNKSRPVSTRYYCEICYFGENNYRTLETHVLVHGFLLEMCKKEVKNFDPEDYVLKNPNFELNGVSPVKNFSCLECSRSDFDSFRKFSMHRRNEHSIYHCDLCSKFYGRNSHLWKHVHRLHKGHPSITCQICSKTSASKYHLAQHFAKIHQLRTAIKQEEYNFEDDTNGMHNFKSRPPENLKDDFTKQDFPNSEPQISSYDENSLNQFSQSDNDNSSDAKIAPKEIDPSHDLYTNILTNYTPPKNEGDFKCPKCSKGFHKRMLLRKHKKNCRPKLQKDLLTRCKSCARIFKDRQSLAKHLVNYHSDYICEICTEKVPSKCEIVTHIRFQHPSSHLVCSVCENILRCKKDLLEHLADHENSYVCQFCGDTLSSKVKLKMHILSLHRKILSLSCGICLKLFENQHVLKYHVSLIHKDRLDPLTSCPICGKSYGSKWKTFDHVNKSHGRIFKPCKICLEIFETESELEYHIKTAHITLQVSTQSTVRPNPAAMINSPVKTESSVLNSNKNRNDSESDSEENTEETENNTQSSESEDDENNRPDRIEEQKRLTIKNFMTLSSQENKISLLEKRLLGKTVGPNNNTDNEKIVDRKDNSESVSKNSADGLKKDKPGLLKIDKGEGHSIEKRSDSSPPIHHSKRTVYVNSNDPSFCEICHKTWPAKKHLWQHYIRCHKKIAATVCGICLKTNTDYENLQIHLRQTHPTLLHGQGYGSNFICRICGRYHNASSKLSLHMVIHEKFDWKLLEKFPPLLKYPSNIKKLDGQKRNGSEENSNGNGLKYEPVKVKKETDIFNENDDIYDDMIEQVEESSSSSETETGNKRQESTTDSEDNKASAQSVDCNLDDKQFQSGKNNLTFTNLLQTLKNHNQFEILNQIQKDLLLNISKPLDNTSNSNILDDASQSSNISNAQTLKFQHTEEHKYAISNTVPTKKNSSIFPGISSNISTKVSSKEDRSQGGPYMGHSYLSEESSSSLSECDEDVHHIKSERVDHIKSERVERDGDRNNRRSSQEVDHEKLQDNEGAVDEEGLQQDEGTARNLFRPKPEELVSAIKSISVPCADPPIVTDYNDFSEPIQSTNCLNDTEIENAVGSIL